MTDSDCEELIHCILDCIENFRKKRPKKSSKLPGSLTDFSRKPDGLKPVRDEPGVYKTPSGSKVDVTGTPIPDGLKPIPKEPGVFRTPEGKRVDSRGKPVPEGQKRPSTARPSGFCDWLVGNKPEKDFGSPGAPAERFPSRDTLRPLKGDDDHRRPIPDGLKSIAGEPGVYKTPQGKKVDSQGQPVPEGLKPVKGEPGVFKTPSGSKVNVRGTPVPDGLKPVPHQPGVFTTPEGRRVDSRRRPIPEEQAQPRPRSSGICDWLVGNKPEKDYEPSATPAGRLPAKDTLKPVKDDDGRPVPDGLKPVSEGNKPVRVEPAESPRQVDSPGRPISTEKPENLPQKSRSFCDWLLGNKPEPFSPIRERAPAKDIRQPGDQERPIPDGLKPVKKEPGVFRAPSGREVDIRGNPASERLKPVPSEPGVFEKPNGRKVDSRRKLVPERDESSGQGTDGDRPVSRGSSEKSPDNSMPSRSRFCDWLLWNKPEKESGPRSLKRVPSRGNLNSVKETPSDRPIRDGLKPVRDKPVSKTPSSRKVDRKGNGVPQRLKPERDASGEYPSENNLDDRERPVTSSRSPTKLPDKSKSRFCDWLLGNKPESPAPDKGRFPSKKSLKPVRGEPTKPSELYDDEGRPIPEGLKPVKGEPGIYKTPSGAKVDRKGKPILEVLKPVREEPRKLDDRGQPVSSPTRRSSEKIPDRSMPPKSSFCDWLLGNEPTKDSGPSGRPTKRTSSRESLKPVKSRSVVSKTPSGGLYNDRGRPIPDEFEPGRGEPGPSRTKMKRGDKPIPDGLKPVKDEPGVFKTPSGSKVDMTGTPIPDGLKPVPKEPGVFRTPEGRKVDSRGKPIPEGLTPTSRPGIFTDPSGRKVDDRGIPVRSKTKPIGDSPDELGSKSNSICDWLLGEKPKKRPSTKGPKSKESPNRKRSFDSEERPSKDRSKRFKPDPGSDTTEPSPTRKKPRKPSGEDLANIDPQDCEEFIECVQKCLIKHKELKKKARKK